VRRPWRNRDRRQPEPAPSTSPPQEAPEVGADRGEHYRAYVARHLESDDAERGIREAIGGNFDTMGLIQRDLLVAHGLETDGTVVDVGCGSGRLAAPLAEHLGPDGRYLGTDVVPALVDYARDLVGRPEWRFEVVDDLVIPVGDDHADIVCFFSVMTHLRHEHSYLYLREAKRVVKPTGRIIVSFLEFATYAHWAVFEHNVQDPWSDRPLDQFLSRDALEAFAHHLDLEIVALHGGDELAIPLRQEVRMDHGAVYTDFGTLGQSFVVFARRS
jgi:SAM-dependent methyltransferase